ncbi:MAG: methyltransferase domain-containing protein [Candidatus Magasanikbacteria bacterium]|nr:methyltransferase domain-containing protein [Candidatus Magasanikbacteria bacterium]
MHSGTALIDPKSIFEIIALAPGMRVADLGCGRTGHFVFPASKVVGERGVVYAVEIVKNILESIKSRVRSEGYNNVQPVWADIERFEKVPIPSGSLDSCFMVNVLFMLTDKVTALKEATRLLKSGGTVVVVDWARRLGPLGPLPEQLVLPEAIGRLATNLGLKMVGRVAPGEYHFGLIFQKI